MAKREYSVKYGKLEFVIGPLDVVYSSETGITVFFHGLPMTKSIKLPDKYKWVFSESNLFDKFMFKDCTYYQLKP